MQAQLEKLYALQIVDSEVQKTQQRLASLDFGAKLREQVLSLKKKLESQEKLLHKLDAELIDAELQLKATEEKRDKAKARLYGGTVTAPKELEALEKDIEMLTRQAGELEEKVLEMSYQVEPFREEVQQLRDEVNRLEQELQRVQEEHRTEEEHLKQVLASLEQRRKEALEGIEPPILSRYEQVRSRRGGIGIAKVVEGHCSACGIAVPEFSLRQLREPANFIYCENCGRILYLPK